MHDTASEGLELVSSYPGNPVLPPFIAPGISSGYWHFILFYFPFSSRTAALLRNTAASPAAWSGEALFDAFGAKKPVTELQDPHQRLSAIEESSGSDRERRQ